MNNSDPATNGSLAGEFNNPGNPVLGQGTGTMVSGNQKPVIPTTTNTQGTTIPSLPQSITSQASTPAIPSSTISTASVQNAPQNLQTAQTQNNVVTNPNAFINSLNGVIGNTAGQTTSAENNQSDLIKRLSSAQTQLGTEGAAQTQEEQNLGVPQYMQQIQDLNTSIAQQKGQYMQAEQNALYRVGGDLSYGQGASALAQNSAAIALGTQAALLQAYQGNLTTAQNYAQHVVDLQYQPITNQIQSLKDQLTANQPLMTAQQADRAETLSAALNIQSEAVTQAKSDKQNQFTLAQQAAQSGASTQVASQIANAPSLADAISAYSTIFNGQTPNLPQDVINKAQGNITGSDGKTYATSTFATDPAWTSHVTAAQSVIQKQVGNITDAASADAAIKALAPNSPISGSDVLAAAQEYGVDPALMISIMSAETSLGTQGKGAAMNNFGDIGNTDSAMANGQPVGYPTPKAGIEALAKNLAGRVSTNTSSNTQNGQSAPLQATGNGIDTYNTITKTAPPAVSGLIQYTGDPKNGGSGDIYMQPTTDPIALAYAKSHGIKIVSAQDVSDLKDLNTALTNLNAVSSQFSKVSEGGVGGKIMSTIANPSAEVFDTPRGKDINSYTSTTLPAAINALGAITGNTRLSAYTGSISSSALPAVGTNPLNALGADTTQGGLEKINAIKAQINNALKTILPNTKGSTTRVQITDPKTGQVTTGTIDPKDFDNKTMTIIQ